MEVCGFLSSIAFIICYSLPLRISIILLFTGVGVRYLASVALWFSPDDGANMVSRRRAFRARAL